ncbi:hypothetical protein [Marinoscillum furvescens]|uniref:Uncharacterized protein n=1 Tax=Marinoscillum furvescens DSM 4134 TaxID=1122208 RepID=A0A3D9L1N4_MARFU|nr:hypothetical protein [Marinoscillum furvescens]RED97005.1 hypothetical protein C7460_11353 [Marinoscillum furvescens DSM 4134]
MYNKQTSVRSRTLTFFTLLLLLTLGASPLTAQKLEISAIGQQTVMGMQSGYQVATKSSSGFGVGVFVQSSNHFSLETSPTNYPFYGASIMAPIATQGDIQILAHLKSGIVNNQFLIVSPEIETRLTLTDVFALGVTAALRSREAAIGGKITARVF